MSSVPESILALSCPSVADKGRPIKLGNLTFTWRAPPTDYGPIRFVASIALGELLTFYDMSLFSPKITDLPKIVK